MSIRLVIKAHGTAEARDACHREGIIPMGMYFGNGNTVVAIVNDYALDQICNWYHHPRVFMPGIGYEPGTLLAYSVEQA